MIRFANLIALWLLGTLSAAAAPASPLDEAKALIEAGKPEEAVTLMQKHAREDERDPYRLYNLGLTLYQAGRYDEALQSFQAIDSGDRRELQRLTTLQLGNVQYRLAEHLKKAGQPVGAVASMERALDYFEASQALSPSRETKNNEAAAKVRLEDYLLSVADSADRAAARQNELGRYREEEIFLRNALDGYQRAHEINEGNRDTPAHITDANRRLVASLQKQAEQFGKEADAAPKSETIKTRRQQAIGKYEDALAIEPDNPKLTASRDEQLQKLSSLLTDEAAAQAAPALEKRPEELSPGKQADLERARAKLEEAISLDPKNTRATALNQEIFQKLEASYLHQGDKSLAAAQTDKPPGDRLNQARIAATQFQKALELNPENAQARQGLEKTEALLPDLFGATGEADLARAREIPKGDAASPRALSSDDLQKTASLLDKAIANLDTALALRPDAAAYQKSLEEAQKLLDATNDEANRRKSTAQQGEGRAAPHPQDGNAEGKEDGEAQSQDGKMLPLTLNHTGSQQPRKDEKFWNRKIRDW